MTEYFSSKIYNNHNKTFADNKPAFSILNEVKNFKIKDAVNFANSTPEFRNIFLILSGQQNLHNRADESHDFDFGLRLTGADRLSNNGNNGFFWNGKFDIYKSTPGGQGSNYKTSMASSLYDKFKSNSLIIDVINSKFDWYKRYINNQKSLNFLFEIIYKKLLKQIINISNVNIIIYGFSRGAILGIYLINKLSYEAGLKQNIKAFITSDPVINPLTAGEIKDLDVKWYRRDNGNWRISDTNPPFGGTYIPSYDYFPVIRAIDNIPCYNVFQRRSIFSDEFIKWPIGSAVSNAISLNNIDDSLNEINSTDPFSLERLLSQYDENADIHTPDMVEDHWEKMVKIADKLVI